MMDIPDQLPERDILLQVQYGIVSTIRKRLIYKFEHQAGAKQQKNQYSRHTSQTPGKRKPEGAFLYQPGTEMQQQAPEVFP